MKNVKHLWMLLVLAAGLVPAQAQEAVVPVGISEHLGQTLPMNVELYDENGYRTPLSAIINKPTILMFVYYKCPGICTPLLNEVSKIVEKVDLEPGTDYQVLTVSFDPEEMPDLAKEKKDSYLGEMKRKINPAGWRFMTADSENIRRLTEAAGFYVKKENGQWVHSGALIAVSPTGKVTRYLVGIKHLPFDVKMAVYEAHEGRTGPTIAKVMKFCFAYDAEGKRYAFDIVRVSGVLIVGFAGVFALIFLRKPRKQKDQA